MKQDAFDILSYSHDNLALALSNKLTSTDKVKAKMHFKYFREYFGNVDDGLDAKTILIENKYLSKSYLIDYSNFYSTCFNEYDRFCKRVHFFSKSFTKRQFDSILKNNNSSLNKIWDSYLGYIVVKPLPGINIGASLLKTYSSTAINKRYFPASKEYKINLFGKTISFNSLAFQEQDSVVGACASSALWSAFHKTSQLFQTPLPSPSDITKSAKNLFQNSGRTYPNSGLDHFQIGNAIESVGLVSELRNSNKFADVSYLKAFVYAYNKMGLPILLGIDIVGLGGHLITIIGYKEENNITFPRTPEMSLKASKIERLYVHDDQIGPFSRLGFNAAGNIITGWWDTIDGFVKKEATLLSVFIPIHNKIRLTFENVYAKIRILDFYFFQRLPLVEVYWDIFLSFSNDYKEEINNSKSINPTLKRKLLIEPLPKYIWLAKGYLGAECIIELIFDATQIATSDFCLAINIFNTSLRSIIAVDILDLNCQIFLKNELSPAYLDLLKRACK